MDVTYTDASWDDVGILPVGTGDWAYGSSENDFELKVARGPVPEPGSLVYVEDSEVGGMVTGLSAASDSSAMTVSGATWTGVLGRKVVGPDAGDDYLVLSGDVRDVVASLVSRAGLDGLFSVSGWTPGVDVTHRFSGRRGDAAQEDAGRYMSCWAAIWQVLLDAGCKTTFRWDVSHRRVVMTVSRAEQAVGDEFAESVVRIKRRTPVNHLVCLGKGELRDRAVAHVYLDAGGAATSKQFYTGVDEVADVWESTNDEGDELVAAGKRKIAEMAEDAVSVEVDAADDSMLDVGDVVGGEVAGTQVSATVTKKVVMTSGDAVTYTYETTVR